MINTTLLSPHNILVIAVFAIIWQIILSRATAFLHTADASAESVSA